MPISSISEPASIASTESSPAAESTVLQCMEVWGGNRATESAVAMSGLDAWVWSVPYGGESEAGGGSSRGSRGSGSGDEPAGGDIHYVSSCGTGRIIRLLVADVSGHGSAVAGIADALRALMRRYVNQLDQAGFVRALNREFKAIVESGRFATAVVATFWSPTGDLEIHAGHPRPLLFQAREGRWSMLDAGLSFTRGPANIPLGLFESAHYEPLDTRLENGDLVLLYSDAMLESQDASGAFLGEEGLVRMVERLDPRRPDAFLRDLAAALATFRGDQEADDDQTLLLFTPNGRAPRMTVGERWQAAMRMLGAFGRSLVGGAPMPWPDLRPENVGGVFLPSLGRRWARRGRR